MSGDEPGEVELIGAPYQEEQRYGGTTRFNKNFNAVGGVAPNLR